MSRINSINGSISRSKDLTRLWTDFNNLWNRKASTPTPSSDAPPAPAEPPKQAIHNRQNGARWFFALQQSLSRRSTQKNASTPAKNVHVDGPGLSAEQQDKDQDERKVVAPIPKNAPGDRPIKVDKPKGRLIADTSPSSEEKEPANKNSVGPKQKRKGKRAKQAASRRKI